MLKAEPQLRPGYKNSPLGPIPNEWEMIEFGDLVQLEKGKYIPSKLENIKCLELEHLEQGTGQIIGWVSSSEQKSTKNKFQSGQVLFGKLRPYLQKYWLAKFDGVCSSEIWVLNSKYKNCTNYFLFRLVQTSRFIQVANVSSGSKMPRADWDYVSNFPFVIPSINEQQAIANILKTTDDTISLTQTIIRKLEIRNKGLQQKLLTGKTRIAGFSGKWKTMSLGEIFERVTRKNIEINTNVLTISAQKGLINQENYFTKQIASEILDNYFLLLKDEFAYNKSYSNGYPMGAIKRLKKYEKGVVTTLYICFKLKKELNFSLDFFEQFFENQLLVKGLEKIAHEGGRAHGLLNVTPSDFFGMKISIPGIEEQKAIANILNRANEEVEVYKQKLEKLKQTKKGLIQQLLTGKVRVQLEK